MMFMARAGALAAAAGAMDVAPVVVGRERDDSVPTDLTSTFGVDIERDRKQLLLKSVRSTTLPTIAAVLLVSLNFWGRGNRLVLAAWAMLTIGVGVFRYAIVKKAGGRAATGQILDWAHRRTMIGTVAAAAMWIVALPVFYSGDIIDMMVPGFLYVILCCAGTISLSVYKRAFLVFVPPIMLGVVAMFLYRSAVVAEGRANSLTIAVALALMTAVLFRLMRQTDEQLTQTLRLNYQNGKLVGDLKQAQERTEDEKSRQVRRREEMERLTLRFEQRVSGLMADAGRASDDLLADADSTGGLVRDTLQQASQVAGGAQEVAERIQVLSTAAQQLSSSIELVNGEVRMAAGIAQKSVAELARTNDTVHSLSDASQRVGEIVGMITVIARQTNMLALNATIEAQRAGEAGRGFAVVAGEVKNLASQTTRAAREVTEHIDRIQATTDDAMAAIRTIGDTILEVNGIAERVVSSVQEQGVTTNSISLDLHRIAGDTAVVTEGVIKLNESASLAVAATEKMTGVAAALAQSARETMGQIREFLVGVQQQS